MVDSSLVGRCGIYCGACFVYRASKDRGRFPDRLSEEFNVPKDVIRCGGCLGPHEELWQNCRECAVRACLGMKGYDFCYECPSFAHSCDSYERICGVCSERGEDIRGALRRIKAGEAEAWLKEQNEKWRCPSCRKPISWYEVTCRNCGNSCVSPQAREKLERAFSRLRNLQPKK